jgi:CheY-like chemotaxis protein
VLNLLSNAIKFNRPGGSVSVVCDVAEEGRDRGRLAIGVRDTGEGIPPERRDELFLPFSRLEADRAGIEGTGLGLTLCRRLIEAMDGRIHVESVVGEGSTFWIELPLASSPLERIPRTESEGGPSAVPARASAVQKATILYIEDNLANLSLVETIFDDRPAIHFLPALQGRLGIEIAQQHSPHLILLDLHLPDIPGEEVLRQLRLDPATRNIPVIVISADATPRQIANLRRAGAVEYLTKPLDIDRFREVVDGLLAARTTLPESP